MSSRALRRLQKEQIPDIVSLENSDNESEEEEEVPIKQINPFDLLNEDDDNIDDEEEEEQENVVEKEEYVPIIKPTVETKSSNKKSKQKKKKKNSKKNDDATSKKKNTDDISMKELDKVLEELGQTPSENAMDENENLNSNERRQLLSINYRYLDAEAEMKRLFGSHIVNSENRASQGRVLKKSKFTTPKNDWAPYKRNGLSMEVVETVNGVSYYAFRHSEQYQDIQLEFLNAVATYNPEALLFLVRRHPYHVDSLLQLSEVAKHSGDWTTAGDFIERALYACERALHPQFSLSTGTVRLSYKRSENRSFFLAIFRHIQFLTRRGCWRTAFEFSKLLFSLDPESDPLATMLTLDYHALSCREYEYILKMQSEWKTKGDIYPIHLTDMPNFAYSAALAKFKMSKNDFSESKEMLKEAIKKYPLLYCRLLEKLGEEVKEMNVLIQKHMPNKYMDIVQLSYVERVFEIWKEPSVIDWLKETGSTVIDYPLEQPNVIQKELVCQVKDIPLNVCRYIVMIDIQSLMSYLPTTVTEQSYEMYDPLPPEDSITMYDLDERMRHSNRLRGFPRDAGGLIDMLRNFLGPGGRQVPGVDQQQIRQLMTELERLRQQNADQAPGAFPGANEEEEDYPELADEEQENNTENQTSNDQGISAEEMMEIMNAIDEEDLEVQRALEDTFGRNTGQ
ncbi:transcriptional repressor TCF25-domain-containing protein [Cokeromyces recurvatus]|uniref:transcriptional repressor TCF25-domain-containing protein n=1 Tax=Cokeromyces recurvatus TaxID=90255 RepID=UPI0022212475|nr:transcriptional repressor TCF25-domain-containing protein [Cokeromyces recurvatus]KAI7902170.1 transcriptional repressor TCF25-domain-containing protein [Cokeromyces recurvatus]